MQRTAKSQQPDHRCRAQLCHIHHRWRVQTLSRGKRAVVVAGCLPQNKSGLHSSRPSSVTRRLHEDLSEKPAGFLLAGTDYMSPDSRKERLWNDRFWRKAQSAILASPPGSGGGYDLGSAVPETL